MTVPSTNVGLSDIQSEFGGSNPISISEYYAQSLLEAVAVEQVLLIPLEEVEAELEATEMLTHQSLLVVEDQLLRLTL